MEDLRTGEGLSQETGIIEIEGKRFYQPIEGIRAVRRARESPDAATRIEKAPGDVFSGIAESARDYVNFILHHTCAQPFMQQARSWKRAAARQEILMNFNGL
jgi:hypothetical protein